MSQPDQSRQVSAGAVSSRLRGSARRLFVTYDEHDGFFDHQLPPFPEATVTDEFIGGLPIGPGWAGVKPAGVTSWRASVTGDLTAAFDFRHPTSGTRR